MPHLSPLAWALAPFMLFFLMSFMHTSMWWFQMPTFMLMAPKKSTKTKTFKSWKW